MSEPMTPEPVAATTADARSPLVGTFDRHDGMTCGRCEKPTGNSHQGHYWAYCKAERRTRAFHFCCPGDCQLASPRGVDEILAETAERMRIVVEHRNSEVARLTEERDAARGALSAAPVVLDLADRVEAVQQVTSDLAAARAELAGLRQRVRQVLAAEDGGRSGEAADPALQAEIRASLAGRDVACWCKTTDPCHGDVLLEVANASR